MSSGVPIHSSRRPYTFVAGELFDDDGIKTAFATTAAPVTLVPADLNGAAMSGSTGRIAKLPRTVTLTLSNSAGAYVVAPIVITGKRGGRTVTESLTPTTVNGNEALRGVQLFDSFDTMAFPAQGNGAGQFKIGVQDIGATVGDTFTAIELSADGVLNEIAIGGALKNSQALLAGVLRAIASERINTDPTIAAPTTVGLTVYLP